jgi:hypothetical protein
MSEKLPQQAGASVFTRTQVGTAVPCRDALPEKPAEGENEADVRRVWNRLEYGRVTSTLMKEVDCLQNTGIHR